MRQNQSVEYSVKVSRSSDDGSPQHGNLYAEFTAGAGSEESTLGGRERHEDHDDCTFTSPALVNSIAVPTTVRPAILLALVNWNFVTMFQGSCTLHIFDCGVFDTMCDPDEAIDWNALVLSIYQRDAY